MVSSPELREQHLASFIPSDLRPPERPLPDLEPAATRIGHVHLKVAELDRTDAFYRDVLGLEVAARYGQRAAFLSAGATIITLA